MSFAPVLVLAAFGAGLLSILSPCVVSLLPSYLAYLAGRSLEGERASPLCAGG
jgi:cytochrome c-type biogenesis protein